MSYECFEALMDTLKNFWENMCELEKTLGVQFEENWMTDHFDAICEAITNEFEGPNIDVKTGPIILYWAFDMNWGEEKTIIPYKGTNYEVKHLKDLYRTLNIIKYNNDHEEEYKEVKNTDRDFLEERYLQVGGSIDIA